MELAVLTLFAVLLIGALAGRCPYFVCPDSRSDPVFGIQLEMWIYPGTDGENVFKRRKYSKKCADHYDDHRSSYRVMEIIRNDPGYCWLLCAADHTFRIFAAYLFVK